MGCVFLLQSDVLLSSYLRRLRGGVGWHVTGCTIVVVVVVVDTDVGNSRIAGMIPSG
jgi:hypothetical protein